MEGMKFLVLREIDVDNADGANYVVAVDAVGAGVGEVVMYAQGSSARQTTLTHEKPCDAVVMAIVLALALRPPTTLWALLVIKFELLIQMSPAFVLGTLIDSEDRRSFHGNDIQAGLLVGLVVSLALYGSGLRSPGGFHAGAVGVSVNYATAVTARWFRLRAAAR